MRVFFFMEDKFGRPFMKKFFSIKNQSGEIHRDAQYSGDDKFLPNNPKSGRDIKLRYSSNDRIVIVVDADRRPINQVEKETLNLIDRNFRNKVRVAVLTHEIEEWICYSEDISFRDRKPSEVLKYERDYQKFRLPDYADRMDCQKLQHCESFRRFLNAVNG